MAVSITETKVSLRTVITKTNADGNLKKRSITLSGINNNASNDSLYNLANGIASLVDGDMAGAVKGKDEYLEEK